MSRIISVLLTLALIGVMALPVSAEEDSAWTELLETTSVNSDGTNTFTVSGTSGSVTIPLYTKTRLRRIDMLIWNPSGQRFNAASVTASGSTTNLEIYALGGNLTRVVGYVPSATYSTVTVKFTKATTSTQSYEVLSCKVTALGVQEFVANADLYIRDGYYETAVSHVFPKDEPSTGIDTETIRLNVYDWQAYDTLTIWGSATNYLIKSIRATVGTSGLPFTLSYMDASGQGYWIELDEFESGYTDDAIYSGEDWIYGDAETMASGKLLFCITIPLDGVDRTLNDPLYVYLTGDYDTAIGYTFNCQYVNGSVYVADTTEVTWWTRFTAFMTGLFGKNDPAADEYQSEMESQGDAMQDAIDEMDQVTRPNVDDLDVSLDTYMSADNMTPVNSVLAAVFQNDVIVTMLIIALTCAFVSFALFGKR